jgi:hypothetical protein
MEELTPKGLTTMATISSNLTLSSVTATVLSCKRTGARSVEDKAYNSGIDAALAVIKVYSMVLAGQQKANDND